MTSFLDRRQTWTLLVTDFPAGRRQLPPAVALPQRLASFHEDVGCEIPARLSCLHHPLPFHAQGPSTLQASD